MKLAAVALDYDGTIAVDGVMDPQARDAIAHLRIHGIAVVLVTGRRLADLKAVAGDLECFNAVVAENGAILYFPESQRHTVIGTRRPRAFSRTSGNSASSSPWATRLWKPTGSTP